MTLLDIRLCECAATSFSVLGKCPERDIEFCTAVLQRMDDKNLFLTHHEKAVRTRCHINEEH